MVKETKKGTDHHVELSNQAHIMEQNQESPFLPFLFQSHQCRELEVAVIEKAT